MAIGWNDSWENILRQYDSEVYFPGRVLQEERTHLVVAKLSEDRKQISILPKVEISGKLKLSLQKTGDRPVVGDWVILSEDNVCHGYLPRQSKISRNEAGEATREQILASNIDKVFILSSMNDEFNPARLERYLTLVRGFHLKAEIILTKKDLSTEAELILEKTKKLAGTTPVHCISLKTNEGLPNLFVPPGETVVLLGSSGVGKSSLVNYWLGNDELKTQEIRESDSKGRHTTTGRSLKITQQGFMVVDTPGMRELQLWLDQENLLKAFEDIENLALKCKFSNCTHTNEPGCAVQNALRSSELSEQRFQNFTKMQEEVQNFERRKSKSAEAQYKKGLKSMQKAMRVRLKEKGRK